jgi:hypothetical protein
VLEDEEKRTLSISIARHRRSRVDDSPHCDDQEVHTLKVGDWLRIGIISKEIAGIFDLSDRQQLYIKTKEKEEHCYQMDETRC